MVLIGYAKNILTKCLIDYVYILIDYAKKFWYETHANYKGYHYYFIISKCHCYANYKGYCHYFVI